MSNLIQPPPSAYSEADLKAMAKRYESCAPVARELVAVLHDYWNLLQEVQNGRRRETHAATIIAERDKTLADRDKTIAERERQMAAQKQAGEEQLAALRKEAEGIIQQHRQQAQGLEAFLKSANQQIASLEAERLDLIARATEHYEARTAVEKEHTNLRGMVSSYAAVDPYFAEYLKTDQVPQVQE